MKRWIIFTILCLLTKLPAFACGPYYPYGDDVRFRLLAPEAFPAYNDFFSFHYTSGFGYYPHFGSESLRDSQVAQAVIDGQAQNIALWKIYCHNQADAQSIDEAVYELAPPELHNKKSSNAMVRYLQSKDTAGLNYLYFAKLCENGNAFYSDPWERQSGDQVPDYMRHFLQDAETNSERKELDGNLRLRYAFLAVRLAFYQQDSNALYRIYDRHFSKRSERNILDYWALHFRLTQEGDSVKRNYYAALVFANAPDKRSPVYDYFKQRMPVEPVLALARNNNERAAVWLTKGVQEPARALYILQGLYASKPGDRGFGMLLLRELNKLEDWIYTPYYTCFYPSVQPNDDGIHWWDQENKSYPNNRIADDRRYAGTLLGFLESVQPQKLEDPQLYYIAKAYLNCMLEQYDQALKELDRPMLVHVSDTRLKVVLRQIRGLCLTAKQSPGNAVIPNEIKPLLMQASVQNNYRFVFAIARELEYKGNTKDAALLFSRLNTKGADVWNEEHNWIDIVSWRSQKNHNTLWLDYYTDYFFYLDAVYTPEQLYGVLQAMEQNKATDSFSNWLYAEITPKRERLYDLLGTKYIRQNKLEDALQAFRKVSDDVWDDSSYYFWQYLAANPFYTNMYQEHAPSPADSVRMTKTEITARLIAHLKQAEDPHAPDRDYHYFIAANCYLNMTQYGNSWMMRRYYWTSQATRTKLEDDKEYFQCGLAKQYYLKAQAVSHSKRFAALCLRMAGRCEKYRLYDVATGSSDDYMDDDSLTREVFRHNRLYSKLKKDYPGYYEDLMSNCTAFDRYFAARK